MEQPNIDRRDSKKSGNKNGSGKNQPRGGGNTNGGGVAGKASAPGGDKSKSHSQKSGKRYQEIYKPPSLRSSKNRHSDQSSIQKGSNQDDVFMQATNSKKNNQSNIGINNSSSMGNMSPQVNGTDPFGGDPAGNSYSLFGSVNSNNNQATNGGNSSVPSSPLISSRMQNSFNIGLAKRMLNANAKEFQFLPMAQQQQHQHQQQQISNFLSQFDPNLFYNNSPMMSSSGVYPLKQSKSSGNMNMLLQQAQQHQQAHAAALHQLQMAMGMNQNLQSGNFQGGLGGNTQPGNQFNRLTQSKSSGNVPGAANRPRVRFDDEEIDFDDGDDDFINGQLGNYLASLKMNGDLSGLSQGPNFPMGFPFQQQHQQPPKVPVSPQPVLKSALQKSRTGFYLNLFGNQQQQQQNQPPQHQIQLGSPTKQMYEFNPTIHPPTSNYGSHFAGGAVGGNNIPHSSMSGSASAGIVKRSRSFGPGNHHVPRASATTFLNASSPHGSTSGGHSIYSDFCIAKWPRVVQELVTAAVTGVERIPARNWIEMVNGIFEAMLCDYRPKKNGRAVSGSGAKSGGDAAAVGSVYSASSSTNNDRGSRELSFPGRSSALGADASNWRNRNADQAGENNDLARSSSNVLVEDNEDEEDDEDDDDDTDLTAAAVHIFLYFIQREKDRTVMESLLNTCFASFQRLSTASSCATPPSSSGKVIRSPKAMDQSSKPSISRQWCNFLRFLSALYSQVKLIRRQKQSQQLPGHSMDEMSFSLLALLCDSCLATLRSPQSYTAEMMGCLFTVLTSIGKDMEGTFPLKMKQLLAAVRDALLGIGPYHQQQQYQHHNASSSTAPLNSKSPSASSLSPIVQKTLMQLIELHAANWQLPASAVRYYYSSVSNNNKSTSSSSGNPGNAGGVNFPSSPGNNQNQSQKIHNKSDGGRESAVSSNTTVRPDSTSSVSSNENEEPKSTREKEEVIVESLASNVTASDGNMIEKSGCQPETGNDVEEGKKVNEKSLER